MTRIEIIIVGILAVTIAGFAGSHARAAKIIYQPGKTPTQICARMVEVRNSPYVSGFSSQLEAEQAYLEATELELQRQGYSPRYCENPQKYEAVAKADQEVYNIDTLRVTTASLKTDICASGGVHIIFLEGTISPDSSFAIEKLLKRSPHCRNKSGEIIVATTVQLESDGGYLDDGYKLGKSIRKAGATALIENETWCASSCAVAFLGGKTRVVEDTGAIMFHAPYYSGQNAYGKKVIDCEIPKAELAEMNDYYLEMVGKEAGDRLFERTMWYCSAEDGWVVTGGSAAELFDISTQR